MARTITLFFTVLMVALTAGRAFWVWVAENPSALSMMTYIESFQATNRAIALPIAITGSLGFLLALVAVALSWRGPPNIYLRGAGVPLPGACVRIKGLIKRASRGQAP